MVICLVLIARGLSRVNFFLMPLRSWDFCGGFIREKGVGSSQLFHRRCTASAVPLKPPSSSLWRHDGAHHPAGAAEAPAPDAVDVRKHGARHAWREEVDRRHACVQRIVGHEVDDAVAAGEGWRACGSCAAGSHRRRMTTVPIGVDTGAGGGTRHHGARASPALDRKKPLDFSDVFLYRGEWNDSTRSSARYQLLSPSR